jgi:hypothetical protein
LHAAGKAVAGVDVEQRTWLGADPRARPTDERCEPAIAAQEHGAAIRLSCAGQGCRFGCIGVSGNVERSEHDDRNQKPGNPHGRDRDTEGVSGHERKALGGLDV